MFFHLCLDVGKANSSKIRQGKFRFWLRDEDRREPGGIGKISQAALF